MAIQVAFHELGVFPASTTQIPLDSGEPMPFDPVQAIENAKHTADLRLVVSAPKDQLASSEEEANLTTLQAELQQALQHEISLHTVALHRETEGLVISLREFGFFDSGSDVFKASALPALDRIASILAVRTCRLRIEGHTDNVPIHTAQMASNWELSTARSTELVRLSHPALQLPPAALICRRICRISPDCQQRHSPGTSPEPTSRYRDPQRTHCGQQHHRRRQTVKALCRSPLSSTLGASCRAPRFSEAKVAFSSADEVIVTRDQISAKIFSLRAHRVREGTFASEPRPGFQSILRDRDPKGFGMTTAAVQFASAVDGPPDPELVRIRDLVYQVAGIFHPDNKLRLLLDHIGRRMKELKTQTLREYFECLTIQPTRQTELIALLNEITIGETCFFRSQSQLDALRTIIIPKVLEAKAKSPLRRLRIWSAGCSTGEGPYTLSMVLLEEAAGRLKDWMIEILATDLNERSLAHAKNAIYGSYSTRNLSPYYRQKYFTEVGEQLQVQPVVRNSITFSRLNLSDDARMTFMKSLDVIFRCNVLIYFDLVSKRRVIQHFYNNLLHHGYLFLGHSESLYGVSDDFRLVDLPGATAYIKGERTQAGK